MDLTILSRAHCKPIRHSKVLCHSSSSPEMQAVKRPVWGARSDVRGHEVRREYMAKVLATEVTSEGWEELLGELETEGK